MPYKVYNVSNQYCVHKKNSDGSKGKKIGCHATRTKANAQMRALYANEGKDNKMTEETITKADNNKTNDETKEQEEKHSEVYEYVPWNVYTFAELEKTEDARAVALRVKTLSDQFVEIVYNIMGSEDIEDKSSAVASLSSEYSTLIKQSDSASKEQQDKPTWLNDIAEIVKETMTGIFTRKPEQTNGFMLWKEGDQLRWLARYSNNFRDEDKPPEIISAKSHQRFVNMVDKKEAPLPELWLWHEPEWKLGQADWLAYDDSGFALASGTIDRGKEIVAEQIAKQKLVGVSHGMPVSSIERDPNDPTVIVKHMSAEISPLPHNVAANKLADWILLGDTMKEGNNMPIPDKKKRTLVDDWNMEPELLDKLETLNAQDAERATEEGKESKEATETEEVTEEAAEDQVTQEATEEQETDETQAATEETEAEAPDTKPELEPPSREEIADAIAVVLKPYVELSEQLQGRIKELEKSDEEKVAKAVKLTPSASVGALLAQRFSAIGDDSTKVRKGSKLDKDKPEESDVVIDGPFPAPFLNEMIAKDKVAEE